ncbi:MAG: tRNA (adenosine(37)-N6)-dimethylallyltransferase MiaA [Candidatus Saccharimonadales bacterium]
MSIETPEFGFRERVEAVVAQIPQGRVMSYGQLAALCGSPRAARVVGGIAHFGDPALPWHRVVNKKGGLASGYPGGRTAHAEHLRTEGVLVSNDLRVDIGNLLWWPENLAIDHGSPRAEDGAFEARTTAPKPLIVIVGETASGKSALALEIAQRFNGEIICADAVTVYRGFDIGAAKPSKADQAKARHHLLYIVKPTTVFNAAQFKGAAEQAIQAIESQGKLPILVGGSGLYIDSVLYDYEFVASPNIGERDVLNTMSLDELLMLARLRKLDVSQVDQSNKRRVVRLIENNGQIPKKQKMRLNTCVIGLRIDKEKLVSRIEQRVDGMLQSGLEREVAGLAKAYGWECEPMRSIGYREWQLYFAGQQTLAETREKIITSTMQLAKKQRTWFKRNNSIQWVTDRSSAIDIVTTFLNK